MSGENSVTVDVVSDVVCPWCFIGQKRLDRAIAAADDVEVHVRWRPFQLDPTIPPEGMDRRDYMIAKFGSEERVRQIHARIEPLGEAEGIHFAFDAIKVAANTLDAHRVIRWAGAAGE
ncbi:MAG: disulfide bond formation protein DsbA, partial [Mesorhizobium sp.]